MAAPPLYLDTSVVLRATLEAGLTPEVARRIEQAPALVTSRLALVEASRALHRVRLDARAPDDDLIRVEAEIASLWSRCDIWELDRDVCERARDVSPHLGLRTLDALHLATFLAAREVIDGLELLTVDARLERATARSDER